MPPKYLNCPTSNYTGVIGLTRLSADFFSAAISQNYTMKAGPEASSNTRVSIRQRAPTQPPSQDFFISPLTCHSEGAFVATEESPVPTWRCFVAKNAPQHDIFVCRAPTN